MSETTSHPRVHSVAAAETDSPAPAATALLALAAAALLSHAARRAIRACADSLATSGPPTTIESPAAIRTRRAAAAARVESLVAAAELPALEAARVRALAAPLAAPQMTSDPAALRAAVEKVARAGDGAAVAAAGSDLCTLLDRQHETVFARALVEACAASCVSAGFPHVETRRGEGVARVVALDGTGHALVSEVRIDAAGAPSLATEALGWPDRGCQGALDRFDRELAARGVRTDPPRRQPARRGRGLGELAGHPAIAAEAAGTARERRIPAARRRTALARKSEN
ncbi:MAG: hypothetical protein M5U13_15670 [Thermoanaerobaculia bacterium]|nr:hypothetical protein [Thermoanaerobaculia bacterium]